MTFSKYIPALITLISALAISGIAAFYSVIGLMQIFVGSAVAIAVMGAALEFGKVVSAAWLHNNWHREGYRILRYYLVGAVVALMFITSMGIFAFLSKAHSEVSAETRDVVAQVEVINERISYLDSEKERSEQALGLLDAAIDEYIELGYVTRGLDARREQAEEREYLNSEIRRIESDQAVLRDQRFDLEQTNRNYQAEVAPVYYIAGLIYGNSDEETLDKAVRLVIIIIIFVFDPLAILLLIASQASFKFARGGATGKSLSKEEKDILDKKRRIIQR